ncbi:hypothetical protein JCM10207_001080 [Rhodosporidiobolus poonsookiae]
MPRSKSISSLQPVMATSPLPPSSPSTSAPPRGLAKASSFADLRLTKTRLFKRLKGSRGQELDFGCSGEGPEIEEEDEESEGDRTVQMRPPPTRPPLYSNPPSSSSLPTCPSRPTPYAFPLHSAPSHDELRHAALKREEEAAAAAALDYCFSHARKNSRSSLAHLDTSALLPAIERLDLRRGSVPGVDDGASAADASSRPASYGTSSCSSRPRTNDSLPSFVESDTTVESTGSFPPSPVASPTTRSRPTFGGSYKPFKVDTDAVAAQSRAYAFI